MILFILYIIMGGRGGGLRHTEGMERFLFREKLFYIYISHSYPLALIKKGGTRGRGKGNKL